MWIQSIVKQEIKEKKSVEEWRQRKEEIQAQRSSYPGAVESFYASLNPAQRHFDPQTIEILRKTKVPVPEIKKQGQAPDLEYSRYLVREYEKLLTVKNSSEVAESGLVWNIIW